MHPHFRSVTQRKPIVAQRSSPGHISNIFAAKLAGRGDDVAFGLETDVVRVAGRSTEPRAEYGQGAGGKDALDEFASWECWHGSTPQPSPV